MPNIAAVLKNEIRRLAKKEIKAQVGTTKQAVAKYRSDIAKLKRSLSQQEREIKLLKRQQGQPQTQEEPSDGVRFSARSVKAQRQRLGLSAADYGKLVGVSGLTIYNWEHEKARPRKAQLAALVAVRGIGKREALMKLAELTTTKRGHDIGHAERHDERRGDSQRRLMAQSKDYWSAPNSLYPCSRCPCLCSNITFASAYSVARSKLGVLSGAMSFSRRT